VGAGGSGAFVAEGADDELLVTVVLGCVVDALRIADAPPVTATLGASRTGSDRRGEAGVFVIAAGWLWQLAMSKSWNTARRAITFTKRREVRVAMGKALLGFSVTSWQKIIKAEYRYVEPAACFDGGQENPVWPTEAVQKPKKGHLPPRFIALNRRGRPAKWQPLD